MNFKLRLAQTIFHLTSLLRTLTKKHLTPRPPTLQDSCNNHQAEAIFVCFLNQEFATKLVGDFKMVNIVSHMLVDSVAYFRVKSRKLRLNILNNMF